MALYSFDTETDLVQPGLAAPPIAVGSWADEHGSHALATWEVLPFFRERLERGDSLVGVNIAFDLVVCCAADPTLTDLVFAAVEEKRVHDVGLREALIDIAHGKLRDAEDELGERYGMGILSERYFGEDVTEEKKGADSWRRRYALLRDVPVEQWPWAARRYVLRDAAKPLEIFHKQEGGPNLHDEFRQVRAALSFELMRVWGLRTSREKVGALETEVEAEWLETRRELQKVGIFRADFTQDKKRTQELVTAAYGGDPPRTEPTAKFPNGQVATDRDTLVESGDPTLAKLGSSGKNDKRKTLYLKILKKGLDVPWNPQFNPLVATTRGSSDAQQFPTGERSKGGIREAFEPRPGCGYFSVDFEGLELRTMAQRAIDEGLESKMAWALNQGEDPHLIVAAQMMGRTYESVRGKKNDPEIKPYRNLAKIFNFGKGGGMGAGAMAYNAREKDGIRFCVSVGEQTEEQCKRSPKREVFVRGKKKGVCVRCFELSKRWGYAWLDAWPEQKELFRRATLATECGPVNVTIPGSRVVRGDVGYSQWLNTPFQGLGAHIAKDAAWRVSREMHTDRRSPLWGAHLELMVHDELIGEAPLDRLPEAAERVSQIMEATELEWLPGLTKRACKAEPAISLIMSKKMEPVRDVGGRLWLWEPEKKAA